jgi:hypothetical protein
MLKSRLFRDIDRLQDCAERDVAHVMFKTPRERGAHVRAIHKALEVLDGANIKAAEISAEEYGEDTAKAVLAYKEKRGIRRAGQPVADNIVGTGTIRKMDEEWLNTKEHHGLLKANTTETLKQDICMSFEGGTVTAEHTALKPLTQRVNSAGYLKTHHPLRTFDFKTHYLSRDKICRDVLDGVARLKRQGASIDRILIHGTSSGGKIALMVANGLFTHLSLRCRYLCVGDAALDKGDPLFAGGPGVALCQESINFYQLWGNDIDPSGEQHGPIVGFQNNVPTHDCERLAELAWNKLDWIDRRKDGVRTAVALAAHTCNDAQAQRRAVGDMNRIMLGSA